MSHSRPKSARPPPRRCNKECRRSPPGTTPSTFWIAPLMRQSMDGLADLSQRKPRACPEHEVVLAAAVRHRRVDDVGRELVKMHVRHADEQTAVGAELGA